MRKRYCIILSLLAFGFYAAAQTTLAQWNFNSSFTIPANGTVPGPSSGVSAGSTLVLTGGINGTNVAGVNADPGNPNRALSTLGYPVQGTAPKTAGIQIQVNTAGYNSVHLKFYIEHSTTAAKKIVVQYFDGAIWQDVSTYTYLANNTNFSALQDVDLSAFTSVNNNVSAQIRLVTDFSLSSSYEGAAGTYSTSGTIHYDLVTITGNPNGCIGPATIQATGFRLLKSNPTSAQLTLNRGNGMGCLVVCSQSGIPSAPANGSNYVANSSFGAGNAIGNGFAVLNTWATNLPVQYFNITGLVAGTKYYVAAYEYSNGSYCYLGPGYVDSFYCNSTVLYPGDLQFIGYDNDVAAGGRDAFAITNLKPITTGTAFEIVNSRYEAGAPANTRTNRWYAGGNNIYQNLQRITVLYIGTSTIPAGSTIAFDHLPQSPGNIQINGTPTTNLTITDNLTLSSLLSSSGAEQFFLTQGKFTSFGTVAGNDQYSLLDGHVLHGVTYTYDWVDFSQPCSSGNTNADRKSRLPPDVRCLNVYFEYGDYAYYQTGNDHIGSPGFLTSKISNRYNWNNGPGGAGLYQIAIAPFTVTPGNPSGTWTGNANTSWFSCSNWEGHFVPDSTTDAIIPVAPRRAEIDINNSEAVEYNRQAIARALTITTGSVAITGNASDKIVIYDSLLVGSAGSFATTSGLDTVIVRGNLQFDASATIQLSNSGWLNLEGNRLFAPINVSLANATPIDVHSLTINNGPGVSLLKGGFQSLSQLQLLNGVLSITNSNAFHYISQACTIISPINQFAETNIGWEKSFIDGKVFVRTNSTGSYTAPVGNASKNVFAPMVFQPDNNTDRTYEVKYTPVSHPNVAPADIATPPLDRVSKVEYWSLTCGDPTAAAKVTLYYTPFSHVGGGGNDGLALNDLRIAQYWDSNAVSTYKWRLYATPGTYNAGLNINYGKISYNQYATDLRPQAQNFTLATISAYNILPIQLVKWKAMLQGKTIQLNWQITDESMVRFYTVERSVDGIHFTSLQTIYNAGSLGNFNYIRYDDKPIEGWNYYRLKATGTDGKIFYSMIEKIWNTSSLQFTVYPNPASDQLWLQLPAAGMITLYTLEGKVVLQQNMPALSNKLNVKAFSKGMYVLEYFDGRKRWSEKIRLQ